MDMKSLSARVRGIIAAPANEWVAIASENK